MATSKIIDYFRLKDIVNQRIVYDLPLNYTDSQSSSTIKVAITITSKYDKNLHNDKEGFEKCYYLKTKDNCIFTGRAWVSMSSSYF